MKISLKRILAFATLLTVFMHSASWADERKWFATAYYGFHSVNTIGTSFSSFDIDTNRYLGLGLGREIVGWKYFSLEAEGIFAEHFGGAGRYEEMVAALVLRYHYFPWDKYLKTTVAIADGPSYATGKIDQENRNFMNYLSAEITLSLPAYDQFVLVGKFHHRSGGDGWLNLAKGESNFYVLGLRYRF